GRYWLRAIDRRHSRGAGEADIRCVQKHESGDHGDRRADDIPWPGVRLDDVAVDHLEHPAVTRGPGDARARRAGSTAPGNRETAPERRGDGDRHSGTVASHPPPQWHGELREKRILGAVFGAVATAVLEIRDQLRDR